MATTYMVTSDGKVTDISAGTVDYTGTASQAIQWANDNLPADGTLYLGSGSFGSGTTLYINKDFIGDGKTNTRLYALPGLTGDLVQVGNRDGTTLSYRYMSDMEIDGMGDTYPSGNYGGVQLVNCDGCEGDDLTIHDFPKSNGFEFQACTNCSFSTLIVYNIGKGGQYGNGICAGTMVAGVSSSHNEVKYCEVYNCTMCGINWEPGNDNVAYRCTIHDMTSWSGGGSVGMVCSDVAGYPTSNNNQFIECTVECDGDSIDCLTAGTTVVKGCVVEPGKLGIGGTGIFIQNSTGSTVTGNYVRPGAGKAGIYFYNSSNGVVTGNEVYDTFGQHSCRGIWATGDSGTSHSGFVIENNNVYDAQYGVLLAAPIHSSTVEDNTCYDCTTCTYIVNSDNTASGNKAQVGYLPMNLTLVVNPASVTDGGTVQVYGVLTVKGGSAPPSGQTITLVADNGDVLPVMKTDSNGYFSFQYTPSAAGLVYISAQFGGSP